MKRRTSAFSQSIGFALSFLLGGAAGAEPARVLVDVGQELGPLTPFWNGTQSSAGLLQLRSGRQLLATVAAAAGRPPAVRFMGVTSSGTGWLDAMNIYHEDSQGQPYYDFALFDEAIDAAVAAGAVPFVNLSFTPDALSAGPPGTNELRASPPRDYERWYALVRAIVAHAVARYGAPDVAGWWWEVWNEPDLGNYWNGGAQEYLRLYDHTVAAVRAALATARVGGPATADTGDLFWTFVEHCYHGTNFRTGAVGAPLDFLSFHAKGGPARLDRRPDYFTPEVVERIGYPRAHPTLGVLVDRTRGVLERLARMPEARGLPIVLSEADVDWGIGVTVFENPNLAYRNDTYYPAFQLAWVGRAIELGDRFPSNPIALTVLGASRQIPARLFDGQRTLVTADDIELPVMHYFRILGKLGARRVRVDVSGDDTVGGIATRGPDAEVALLLTRFRDDPAPASEGDLELVLRHLPAGRWQRRLYRLDATHGNAFQAWRAMGSPPVPTPSQLDELHARQKLEESEPVETLTSRARRGASLRLSLPSHGVALLVLSPEPNEDAARPDKTSP